MARLAAGPLGLVLLVALVLRVVAAASRSLWLDELHSLHYARLPTFDDTLALLVRDNHAPLYPLLLRASVALLGDAPLALRVPSIACGVATVWLAARLARRALPPAQSLWCALFVALSTLHIAVSAEARMYALLALAVVGLADALVATLAAGRRPWAVAAWTAVGLHTHYFFLHHLALASLALAALAVARARWRAGVARAAAGVALGALVAVPWYVWGFRRQLAGDLEPGGSGATLAAFAESLFHLLFYELGVAPAALRPVALGGGALAAVLAALGAWRLVRRRDAQAGAGEGGAAEPVGWLALALALGVPAQAAVASALVPRAGFAWTYLAGSTAPLCVLLAAQAPRARPALAALAALAATMALLAVPVATSRGTEDYRGAVAYALERLRPGDAVVAVEPGPAFFPPAPGWTYYAARLAGPAGAPEPLELDERYHLRDPSLLARHAGVVLLHRGLQARFELLERLRARYAAEEQRRFGYALWVHRFEDPREGE